MIGIKTIEHKIQKKLFFLKLRADTDVLIANILHKIKKTISILNTKNSITSISFLGSVVYSVISNISKKFKLKKLKFIESLRVNKNLKKTSSSSFFLKNMSEYKGKYIK